MIHLDGVNGGRNEWNGGQTSIREKWIKEEQRRERKYSRDLQELRLIDSLWNMLLFKSLLCFVVSILVIPKTCTIQGVGRSQCSFNGYLIRLI